MVTALAHAADWIVTFGPYWGAFALSAYVFSMLVMLRNGER